MIGIEKCDDLFYGLSNRQAVFIVYSTETAVIKIVLQP